MKQDPLESLRRLRQVAADEARRSLAECLQIESEAAGAVAAIEAAIELETEAASSLAAVFYGMNCFDDSPLFVVTWYPLAMLAVVAAGYFAGLRYLRW